MERGVVDSAKLATITTLYEGAHSPDGKMCVMEAVAFVAGELWSDTPKCVSHVIATFLRRWNDDLPDNATRTRLLKPLIPHLIGTRGDEAAEIRRAWMATDWLVRSLAPAFLRATPKLVQRADALEAIGEIVDAVSATAAQPTIYAARDAARTATVEAARTAAGAATWAAAWDAAVDAARDAAWDAAWDAAGDAVWAAAGAAAGAAAVDAAVEAAWAATGAAARTAAGAAARTAAWDAAGDAVWAAAGTAAGAALKSPVENAQDSAVALVLRMCAVGCAC